MGFIAYRIGVGIAACGLSLAAGMPTADADPSVTLPPMTSTGGGPVIGGGGGAQMAQQLKSLNDPNVQEVDGPDAAQFIAAAAALVSTVPALALAGVPLMLLQLMRLTAQHGLRRAAQSR